MPLKQNMNSPEPKRKVDRTWPLLGMPRKKMWGPSWFSSNISHVIHRSLDLLIFALELSFDHIFVARSRAKRTQKNLYRHYSLNWVQFGASNLWIVQQNLIKRSNLNQWTLLWAHWIDSWVSTLGCTKREREREFKATIIFPFEGP